MGPMRRAPPSPRTWRKSSYAVLPLLRGTSAGRVLALPALLLHPASQVVSKREAPGRAGRGQRGKGGRSKHG